MQRYPHEYKVANRCAWAHLSELALEFRLGFYDLNVKSHPNEIVYAFHGVNVARAGRDSLVEAGFQRLCE